MGFGHFYLRLAICVFEAVLTFIFLWLSCKLYRDKCKIWWLNFLTAWYFLMSVIICCTIFTHFENIGYMFYDIGQCAIALKYTEIGWNFPNFSRLTKK